MLKNGERDVSKTNWHSSGFPQRSEFQERITQKWKQGQIHQEDLKKMQLKERL